MQNRMHGFADADVGDALRCFHAVQQALEDSVAADQLTDRHLESSCNRGQSHEVRSCAVLPMRDRGLVDAEHLGELLLSEVAVLAQLRDARMDRTLGTLASALLHGRTVDS